MVLLSKGKCREEYIGLLFPKLNQFPPRGATKVGGGEGRTSPLAALAFCGEIGSKCIVQLAGEHAAPIFG